MSEQFLTLAPQIAGRVAGDGRLGMVMGKVFAPRNPLWGEVDRRAARRKSFVPALFFCLTGEEARRISAIQAAFAGR